MTTQSNEQVVWHNETIENVEKTLETSIEVGLTTAEAHQRLEKFGSNEPPTSSEEILHPELDRAAEPEVVVDPPPPGGAMVEQGRLGELVLRLWLGRLAGEGWGGDRYVTWVGPSGASCIRVDAVADTAEDLIDTETTAEGWVRAATDRRSVEPTTSDGRPAVRLSGCAGP
jgi:hypothetical protein